jgi:hypothetical protein
VLPGCLPALPAGLLTSLWCQPPRRGGPVGFGSAGDSRGGPSAGEADCSARCRGAGGGQRAAAQVRAHTHTRRSSALPGWIYSAERRSVLAERPASKLPLIPLLAPRGQPGCPAASCTAWLVPPVPQCCNIPVPAPVLAGNCATCERHTSAWSHAPGTCSSSWPPRLLKWGLAAGLCGIGAATRWQCSGSEWRIKRWAQAQLGAIFIFSR